MIEQTKDALVEALDYIIQEASDEPNVSKIAFYRKSAGTIDIEGRTAQLVVEVIFDEEKHLDESELYWSERETV